jgi:hypothetical protein
VRTRSTGTWLHQITKPTESYTKKNKNPSSVYSNNDQTEKKDKIGITKREKIMQNFSRKNAQRKGKFDTS